MPGPEHEELVARIVDGGLRTPEQLPSDDAFRDMREAEEASAPPPATVGGCAVTPIDADGVPGLSVTPGPLVTPDGAAPARTALYLHGGGYLWMSPASHLPVLAAVAQAAEARCVGVHYRRAPEHPFPAAVDDAVTAYRWLLARDTGPESIVLVGDSAGGGLVLATMLALRDRGVDLPAAAVCFSPWTDLTVSGDTADTADDPVVSGAALRMMAAAYLGGHDPTSPLASPLFADLRGLPPLQIQVGGRESLRSDASRLAERARQAGVDVTYIEHPGVIHMWIVFAPEIPESRQAFAELGAFVRSHLPGG